MNMSDLFHQDINVKMGHGPVHMQLIFRVDLDKDPKVFSHFHQNGSNSGILMKRIRHI